MHSEEHTLVLTKLAERQLQPKVIDKQLSGIVASVNNRSREMMGWKITPNTIGKGGLTDPEYGYGYDGEEYAWQNFKLSYEEQSGNAYLRYEMYLSVSFAHDTKKPDKNYLAGICQQINTRAAQPATGRWELTSVDDKPWEAPDPDAILIDADSVGYTEVELPDLGDWRQAFTHLYGLDANIMMARRAIETAVLSNFEKRYHTVFIGPPGCGKSDICHTIKKILGEEAVIEFDCTAMTNAGAIKELTDREILPRFVVFEEIEKAPENCLSFMLGMLDQRAEIRKTTARASIQRDTKLYAIATVNNTDLFRKIASGALASRFSNVVFFRRPTREQLKMILEREILSIGGDFAWADPTLDYCSKWGIDDPRKVTALCLCGRELWLTDEYTDMLAATAEFQRAGTITSAVEEDWTTP